MAILADDSADSNLFVKSLIAEELSIRPGHWELQEDSDGEIDDKDESEDVYFVQLGEEFVHRPSHSVRFFVWFGFILGEGFKAP